MTAVVITGLLVPTDEQWWAMCAFHMGQPVPLRAIDRSRPFIYDRAFGAMFCPSGYHVHAASLLLAFHHGLDSGMDVADTLGARYYEGTADLWMQRPGAAWRSGVGGGRITVWSSSHLSTIERRLLGPAFDYIEERTGVNAAIVRLPGR